MLTPTPPFDFEQTLNFVRRFRARDYERNPAHEQIEGSVLQRVASVNGEPRAFFGLEMWGRFRSRGSRLPLHAKSLTEELVYAAQDRIRFFLSLDDDLTPFYTLAQSDPAFSEVVQTLYGLPYV